MLQLHRLIHCLASVHLGHLTPGPSWPSVPSQERSLGVALKPVCLPTKREPSLPTLSSVYAHPLFPDRTQHPVQRGLLASTVSLAYRRLRTVPAASAQARLKYSTQQPEIQGSNQVWSRATGYHTNRRAIPPAHLKVMGILAPFFEKKLGSRNG
jgi:hypothetical protein